jgi:Na+/melibiose symporter-like transporter
MTKNKKRMVSGAAGAIIAIIGIALQNHLPDREKEVQVLAWTLVVLVMATLINLKHLREKWFRKGFALGLVLHCLLIYSVRDNLPFRSLGVAFLVGFPEAVVWQMIFRRLSVTRGGFAGS